MFWAFGNYFVLLQPNDIRLRQTGHPARHGDAKGQRPTQDATDKNY